MRYWARSIQIQWIGSVQLEKFGKKLVHLLGGPLLPVGPVWSLFKWIAPIEIGIHLAVARVGEFVRDNASLGELRRDKEIYT